MFTIDVAGAALERTLSESLTQALETMAFMFPTPLLELPQEPPQRLCKVRIEFTGEDHGTLQMTAPHAFAAILAGSLLGTHPADAVAQAEDALKELANVTCGLFIRRMQVPLVPTVPTLKISENEAFPPLVPGHLPVALNVDGHAVIATVWVTAA